MCPHSLEKRTTTRGKDEGVVVAKVKIVVAAVAVAGIVLKKSFLTGNRSHRGIYPL